MLSFHMGETMLYKIELDDLMLGTPYVFDYILPAGLAGTEQIITVGLSNPSNNFSELYLADIMYGTEVQFNSVVPVPQAVLLFASGLLGLIGVARRK